MGFVAAGTFPTILCFALAAPIFLFLLFPLLSCTSVKMAELYLFNAVWSPVRPATYFRMGYYGFCFLSLHGDKGNFNVCFSTAGKTAEGIAKMLGEDDDTATVQIIKEFLQMQDKVFGGWLTAGGIAWLVSLALVTAVVATQDRFRFVLVLSRWMAMAAFMMVFASAWGATSAVRALEIISEMGGQSGIGVGYLLISLQWIAAILIGFYGWSVSRLGAKKGTKTTVYEMGR